MNGEKLNKPVPVDPGVSSNWKHFHVLKVEWVHYYAAELIETAAEQGLTFKPELYIFGYVIADIIGDIENAFSHVPRYHKVLQEETSDEAYRAIATDFIINYADRAKEDITTILAAHAALEELPERLRKNILVALQWIETQDFHNATELFIAYHAWLAVKKWTQLQLDTEEAEYLAYDDSVPVAEEVTTEIWGYGDAYLHTTVMDALFLSELWRAFIEEGETKVSE